MFLENSGYNTGNVTIGVMLSRSTISNMKNGIVNNRVDWLNRANEKAKTSLYFFSIEDVDLPRSIINGTYYDSRIKNWTTKEFPFPMVFYNRGDVSVGQKGKFNFFKQELRKRGVKSINYINGFNKWEVYRKLINIPEMASYMPDTRIYTGSKDLISMLEKYSRVYLKACRGRKGYHVMRVVRQDDGLYEFSCFLRNGTAISYTVNFQTLLKGIRMFFRSQNFIIQKAIELPAYDGKISDLRAEVQRNGTGNIEITSICVRLSQSGSPVTTHGESYILEEFLAKYKKYNQEQIIMTKKRIIDFLILAYTCIESAYGKMGEMGIDFAIDKFNKIWFIESNSCPTKVSLMNAYDEATIEKAFLNPLEYAKYLASLKP